MLFWISHSHITIKGKTQPNPFHTHRPSVQLGPSCSEATVLLEIFKDFVFSSSLVRTFSVFEMMIILPSVCSTILALCPR